MCEVGSKVHETGSVISVRYKRPTKTKCYICQVREDPWVVWFIFYSLPKIVQFGIIIIIIIRIAP